MCGNPIDTIGSTCSRCGALQTLGLDMNASATQIEDAYRTLVKVWHPDRFQTDLKLRRAAEEKLKEINAAHDYLTSKPSAEKPQSAVHDRPAVQEPEPIYGVEEPPPPAFIPTETSDDEEPEEARRIMKRYMKRSGSKILVKAIVAFCFVAVVWLLWFSFYFFLSANPKTARAWEEFKAEVSRDIRANGSRLWANATENVNVSKNKNGPQIQPAAAAQSPADPARTPSAEFKAPSEVRPATALKAGDGVKPYVTSGLTPMEVLSILGNPTSSSGEKMLYKGSEIDFRNGRVAGWKIDPNTAPIRVKLWPDAAPVPGVTTFAVNSSKSDVIAVQGTPTLFSDNQFGYGNSLVFFQNDRVVGWKEDPASVRLRVVAH
jgi:curved DNA-binding protein CbpA